MSQSQRKVAITKLKIGDFVESVSKQLGDIVVVQNGLITNKKALDELKRKGVIEVIVNDARSQKTNQAVTNTKKAERKSTQLNTFEAVKADNLTLFEQLLEAQTQTEKRVLAQQPIDTLTLERLANQCVKSVHHNFHSLPCIIRSKADSASLLDHSLRVAISLAQYCVMTQLDEEKSSQVIQAALLAHLGMHLLPPTLHRPDQQLAPGLRLKKATFVTLTQKLLNLSGAPSVLTCQLIAHQKERLNGSGYPNGIGFNELSTLDKVFAVAIEYDLQVYGCVGYKLAGANHVIRQLMECSPQQFDGDAIMAFVKAIGVYPSGTLVKLKSQRLAMVLENDLASPTKPKVKAFYNAEFSHHIKHYDIDLTQSDDDIESTTKRQKYQVEIEQIIT